MLEMVLKWLRNDSEMVQNPTFSPENAPELFQPTNDAGSKCQKNCSKKGPKKRMEGCTLASQLGMSPWSRGYHRVQWAPLWIKRYHRVQWGFTEDQEISPRAMRYRHGQWYVINLPWTTVYIGGRMRILQK